MIASHPKLPPNCDLLGEWDNGTMYLVPGDTWLTSERKEWRLVIAAVARCAWLDEGRAYDLGQRGQSNTCTMLASQECRANAEAWRVWGINA